MYDMDNSKSDERDKKKTWPQMKKRKAANRMQSKRLQSPK